MAPTGKIDDRVVLEPAERRLIGRYGRLVGSRARLTESEKIHALHARFEDPSSRRALIHHYLPLSYRLARRIRKGSLLRRIEAGNRAVIECIDRDFLRPEDDMDYQVARRIREAIRAAIA